MRRKRPGLKSQLGSTAGIPLSELVHSSQILLVGWYRSDAAGTASVLKDHPTDEKLQVSITRRKKKCGERRRTSPHTARIVKGGGPGPSLFRPNLSLRFAT